MEDVTDSSALLSAASLSNLGTEVENIEDVARGWGWGAAYEDVPQGTQCGRTWGLESIKCSVRQTITEVTHREVWAGQEKKMSMEGGWKTDYKAGREEELEFSVQAKSSLWQKPQKEVKTEKGKFKTHLFDKYLLITHCVPGTVL